MSDDAEESAVITFRSGPDRPVSVKRHDYSKPKCNHSHIEIDERGGTVECVTCGKHVDPFWYLVQLANNHVRFDSYFAAEKLYDQKVGAAREKAAAKRQRERDLLARANACELCSGIRIVKDRLRMHGLRCGKRDAERFAAGPQSAT